MRSLFRSALPFFRLSLSALTLLAAASPAQAQSSQPYSYQQWQALVDKARGQSVAFNAWGGDERINAYIAWVGERVAQDYGITLTHVKLSDTATAVSTVLAEKTAGKDQGGAIDMIWINGENFAAMKRNGLLFGPFSAALPAYQAVDTAGKPTTQLDFTVPVDGMEAPWGMAQFNFIYDSDQFDAFPETLEALKDWAQANPGRFSYPLPPDFLGSTFLKQALIELSGNDPALKAEPSDADFDRLTAPLWAYLEALHPALWRKGQSFPASGPAMRQLLDDGELAAMVSFTPTEAAALIIAEQLPDSVRAAGLAGGTIANTHFVAIPYNSGSSEAAQVVANFLMSPEAQARKQDPAVWGDATVLDTAALSGDAAAAFAALPASAQVDLGPAVGEPHAGWMERIEAEWQARFGS
jgi:putative thiamine transport system substrate-binding protein